MTEGSVALSTISIKYFWLGFQMYQRLYQKRPFHEQNAVLGLFLPEDGFLPAQIYGHGHCPNKCLQVEIEIKG